MQDEPKETPPQCQSGKCKNYAMYRGLCHQHWEQYQRLHQIVTETNPL